MWPFKNKKEKSEDKIEKALASLKRAIDEEDISSMVDVCNDIIHDNDFDAPEVNETLANEFKRMASFDAQWALGQISFFAGSASNVSEHRKKTMVEASLSLAEKDDFGSLNPVFLSGGSTSISDGVYYFSDNELKHVEPDLASRLTEQWDRVVNRLVRQDEMLALTDALGMLALNGPTVLKEQSLQKWIEVMTDLNQRDPSRAKELARKTIREIGAYSEALNHQSELILSEPE